MTGVGKGTSVAWAPPGVSDRREDFAAYFCEALRAHAVPADAEKGCRDWLRLPAAHGPAAAREATTPPFAKPARPRPIVIIPGMFGECVAPWTTPFADAHTLLRERGHSIHLIDVEGRSSSSRNGRSIDAWMGEHAAELDGAIVIAYSKGATDYMHAAVLDANERRWLPRVAALVTIAGVINGTPLASRWAERLEKLLSRIHVPTCGAGDGGGVDSQSYPEARMARDAYLAIERLPATVAVVAVTDEASVNPLLALFHRQLANTDARNDGQVLIEDALLPGSQLVATARADHWSIALPFETSGRAMRLLAGNNHFPRVALVVALLEFIAANET